MNPYDRLLWEGLGWMCVYAVLIAAVVCVSDRPTENRRDVKW